MILMLGMEMNALKKKTPFCYNECTFNVRGIIVGNIGVYLKMNLLIFLNVERKYAVNKWGFW